MTFTRTLTLAGLGLIASTAIVQAQTCFGVEARVNSQTSTLTGAVNGAITATEATILAQEQAERMRLLSAIKVVTAQSSTGSDQFSNGLRSSSQALASTLVSQDQRQAVALASHRYGSLGYDPCASNTKAQGLFQALTGTPATRRQIAASVKAQPGRYANPGDWSNGVKTGTAPDGASLYSGDTAAATKFIDTVVGPPDQAPDTSASSAEGDLDKLEKTGRDTYRSLSASVLADIAADYGAEGPIAKSRALSTHWQGNDGGAAWSAGVAGQHTRGLLQDAVRMEAANLAMLANQYKRGLRTETSAAALLLAMVNARLSNITPASGGDAISSASYKP